MDHISAAQNIIIKQITYSPYYFHNAHIYDEIKLLSLPKFLQNLIYKNEFPSVCLLLYTNPQFTSDDREILHTGVVNSGRDN